jgi:sulfite reductase (NADPH) hemoprotein beta-component
VFYSLSELLSFFRKYAIIDNAMYAYQEHDQRIVNQRVVQFRDQMNRYLSGDLSEDDFRPLRLKNGLYIQKHAPMLRVAIPYGLLSSRQLRALASISRDFDKGYGHFTTRQNIQFNWLSLEKVPDVLSRLAEVQMHAVQTSGNCIRNVTTDELAGVAVDEVVNPLVWCELIRQWSTLHPEFGYLPRKFKIAVSGSFVDRAAVKLHDIGIIAKKGDNDEVGFEIFVGGGLGRTPIIGHSIRDFVTSTHLLSYLEAIMRVYNRYGRRDNKYKARIKILVKELTPSVFAEKVEEEFIKTRVSVPPLNSAHIQSIERQFSTYQFNNEDFVSFEDLVHLNDDLAYQTWANRNVKPHRVNGYSAVYASLKKTGSPPGDLSASQMDTVAELADRFSFGEMRVTHTQNLVLPHVQNKEVELVWRELTQLGLSSPNIGLVTDVIACPGGDFCSLANAVAIPVAKAIQERVDDLDFCHDIGPLELNISGCMNSCGHHHIGNIGILGVDKHGEEWYQVTIGGRQGLNASIGKVIGKSFPRGDIPQVVENLLRVYVERRDSEEERFSDFVERVGIEPFKERVYSAH